MKAVKIWAVATVAILAVATAIFAQKIWQHVDSSEIVITQDPIDGELHFRTAAGTYLQNFGDVVSYQKRGMTESSQRLRFVDGGHATLEWTMQWEMPEDWEHLAMIRAKYPSDDALKSGMIEAVVNKVIYNTGPLMSSKESYSNKRNELTQDIVDQVANGLYMTESRDAKIVDPLSGQEKTVQIAEILLDSTGHYRRSEEPILAAYGVRPFNFQIKKMPYSETVEKQIATQQEINMRVQTAIAAAKEAEQNAITVAEKGKAKAAEARWEQEALKATAVTIAEKERDSMKLAVETAELYKKQKTLRADADAYEKRVIVNADGQLLERIKAWKEVNVAWAQNAPKYQGQWVPTTVFGEQAAGKAGSGAQTMIDLLTAQTAKELSLPASPIKPLPQQGR